MSALTNSTNTVLAKPDTEITNFKILLIEDSELDTLLINKALSKYSPNARLISANCFCEGEKVLESENIDLILLDLGLPDTASPHSTYEKIKKWAAKIPVIVLTNLEAPELARMMIRDGLPEFLHKDMIIKSPHRLQEIIDFSIERHSLRKSSEQKDSILRCFMGEYSVN